MTKTTRLFSAAILLAFAGGLHAQVPPLIKYQGRLLDGGTLINGNVALVMRLYDDPSFGSLLYSDSNTVSVADGLYTTMLGDNTTYGSLTGALEHAQVYLEIEVNGTRLLPRERLVSVPYAVEA